MFIFCEHGFCVLAKLLLATGSMQQLFSVLPPVRSFLRVEDELFCRSAQSGYAWTKTCKHTAIGPYSIAIPDCLQSVNRVGRSCRGPSEVKLVSSHLLRQSHCLMLMESMNLATMLNIFEYESIWIWYWYDSMISTYKMYQRSLFISFHKTDQ